MPDWTTFTQNLATDVNSFPQVPGFIGDLASAAAQGAAFGGPIGAAANVAHEALMQGISLIGRGRREADIIVPIQNSLINASGTGLIDEIVRQMADPSMTVNQLAAMYATVVEAYQKFDAFTRQANFTDGRASHQARDTIRPYIDGRDDSGNMVRQDSVLANLERLILARGGTPPGSVASGGHPGQPPALGSATGQPATGNGLLWAGGAIAAAKLLGFF